MLQYGKYCEHNTVYRRPMIIINFSTTIDLHTGTLHLYGKNYFYEMCVLTNIHAFIIIMLVYCTDDATLNSLAGREGVCCQEMKTITKLSDEDVRSMSFEEKSKWLRRNPVTAARHFQYRLNIFFQVFLKSSPHCAFHEIFS